MSTRQLLVSRPSPFFQPTSRCISPQITTEPHLRRVHALRLRIPVGLLLRCREIVAKRGSAICDVTVIALFGIDDMGARFAAEDLEGEMGFESLGTHLITGWSSFGLGVRFGLTEQIALDVSCTPPVTPHNQLNCACKTQKTDRSEKMKKPLCSAQSIPQTIAALFTSLTRRLSSTSLGQVNPFSQMTR